MDSPPFTAEMRQVLGHYDLDAPRHLFRESIVFPELWRPVRTIQIKHGLASVPNDVNMCRPVIIRIDNDPQAIDA
jgi:hypothetical protein